jgi:hypothetical protein
MTSATGEFAIVALSASEIQSIHVHSQKPNDVRQTLTPTEAPLRFELRFANGERVTAQLTGSGSEPTSLWHVLGLLHRLVGLSPGWDSYGARPLDPSAVRRTLNLLPLLLPDDAPEPSVVPTPDGGVQLEWHRRGIDLEVKVPPTGPISYLIADAGTGEEREWEGGLERDTIGAAFARMSAVA